MNKSIYASIQEYFLEGKCKETEFDVFCDEARKLLLAENYKEFNETFSKIVGTNLEVRKRNFYFYKETEDLSLVVDINECSKEDDVKAAMAGGTICCCILDDFYLDNINLEEEIYKYCEEELGIAFELSLNKEEIDGMNKQLKKIIKEIKSK